MPENLTKLDEWLNEPTPSVSPATSTVSPELDAWLQEPEPQPTAQPATPPESPAAVSPALDRWLAEEPVKPGTISPQLDSWLQEGQPGPSAQKQAFDQKYDVPGTGYNKENDTMTIKRASGEFATVPASTYLPNAKIQQGIQEEMYPGSTGKEPIEMGPKPLTWRQEYDIKAREETQQLIKPLANLNNFLHAAIPLPSNWITKLQAKAAGITPEEMEATFALGAPVSTTDKVMAGLFSGAGMGLGMFVPGKAAKGLVGVTGLAKTAPKIAKIAESGLGFMLYGQTKAPTTEALDARLKSAAWDTILGGAFGVNGMLAASGKLGYALSYPIVMGIGAGTAGKGALPEDRWIAAVTLATLHGMTAGLPVAEAKKMTVEQIQRELGTKYGTITKDIVDRIPDASLLRAIEAQKRLSMTTSDANRLTENIRITRPDISQEDAARMAQETLTEVDTMFPPPPSDNVPPFNIVVGKGFTARTTLAEKKNGKWYFNDKDGSPIPANEEFSKTLDSQIPEPTPELSQPPTPPVAAPVAEPIPVKPPAEAVATIPAGGEKGKAPEMMTKESDIFDRKSGPFTVEWGTRSGGNKSETFETFAEAKKFADKKDKTSDYTSIFDEQNNEFDESIPAAKPPSPAPTAQPQLVKAAQSKIETPSALTTVANAGAGEPTVKTPDLISTLRTQPKDLKLAIPKDEHGNLATHIRITTDKGQQAIESRENVAKGKNPFFGTNIVKVEALRNGQVIKGAITVRPQKEPSLSSLKERAKKNEQAGYISTPTGGLKDVLSDVLRGAKRIFGMRGMRFGLPEGANKAEMAQYGQTTAMTWETERLAKDASKAKEMDGLRKKYGGQVDNDLAAAINTGDMTPFSAKYAADLKPNSPMVRLAQRVIDADAARQEVLASPHVSEEAKESIRANGLAYRKTVYLRHIMGDSFEAWAEQNLPESTIRAVKDELKAKAEYTVKQVESVINNRAEAHMEHQSIIDHFAPLIDSVVVDPTGKLRVIANGEGVERLAETMYDMLLKKPTMTKGPGRMGLPIEHLMRKTLDGPLKTFYTEMTDPVFSSAKTIQAIEGLAIQSRFLDSLWQAVGDTHLSSVADAPTGRIYRLQGKQYGTLDGMYVTKELRSMLEKPVHGKAYENYVTALGLMRLAKLTVPKTWIRNVSSSFQGYFGSGDAYRLTRIPQVRRDIAKLMREFKQRTPWAMEEMKRLIEGEVVMVRPGSMTQDIQFELTPSMGRAPSKIAGAVQQLAQKFGNFYAQGDNPTRILSYYTRRAMGESHERAVQHVQEIYQTRGSQSVFTRAMAKSPVTDFLGFTIDSTRAYINTAEKAFQSAAKGDLVPMLGFATANAAAAILEEKARDRVTKIAGYVYGRIKSKDPKTTVMPQTDIAAMRTMMPPYQKNALVLGYYDKNGDPYVLITDTVSFYPVQMQVLGAMQIAANEGWRKGLEALGSGVTQRVKPNMLLNSLLRSVSGYDISREQVVKDQLLESFIDWRKGNISSGEFATYLGGSVGSVLSEYAPVDAWDAIDKSLDYVNREQKGKLYKNIRGEVTMRSPREIGTALFVPLVPYKVDIETAVYNQGADLRRGIDDQKKEIGGMRVKMEKTGLMPDEESERQAKIAHLAILYKRLDEFISNFDKLNKKLKGPERDALIMRLSDTRSDKSFRKWSPTNEYKEFVGKQVEGYQPPRKSEGLDISVGGIGIQP